MRPDSRKEGVWTWVRRIPPPLLLALAFVASFLIVALPLYESLEEIKYLRPTWVDFTDEQPATAVKVNPLLHSALPAFLFSFPFVLALTLVHCLRTLPRLSILGACTSAGTIHILGIYLLYPDIDSFWKTLVVPFLIAAIPAGDLLFRKRGILRGVLCLAFVCAVAVSWEILKILIKFPGEPASFIITFSLRHAAQTLPAVSPFVIAWALIPPLVPNEAEPVTPAA